jgi:hypothetical protein
MIDYGWLDGGKLDDRLWLCCLRNLALWLDRVSLMIDCGWLEDQLWLILALWLDGGELDDRIWLAGGSTMAVFGYGWMVVSLMIDYDWVSVVAFDYGWLSFLALWLNDGLGDRLWMVLNYGFMAGWWGCGFMAGVTFCYGLMIDYGC